MSAPTAASIIATRVGINFLLTTTDTSRSGNRNRADTRKRLEAQVYARCGPLLQQLGPRVPLRILALEESGELVRLVAAHAELPADADSSAATSIRRSLNSIFERYPRHTKFLERVVEELVSLCCEENIRLILLVSLKEDVARLVISSVSRT